jgi:hypothetical protein
MSKHESASIVAFVAARKARGLKETIIRYAPCAMRSASH